MKTRKISNFSKKNIKSNKLILILYLIFILFLIILGINFNQKKTAQIIGSATSCNNFICDASETCSTCPSDCGSCTCNSNNVCESVTETCNSCPQDCGSCPPTTVSITSPNNNAYLSSSPTSVTGISSNANTVKMGGVTICASTLSCANWGTSKTLSPGSNTITVTAWGSGDAGVTDTKTVIYDPTSPSISIISPQDQYPFSKNTITVSGTANDNTNLDKVEIRVDNILQKTLIISGMSASWNTGETITLKSGSNAIEAKVFDKAGNNIISTRTVSYEAILPSVTLNNPSDNEFKNSQSVDFSCSAEISNDALSNVALYGSWTSGWHLEETKNCVQGSTNCPQSFTKIISDGTFDWNCKSCSSLNNCALAPANKIINIDSTKPSITFDSTMPADSSTIISNSIAIKSQVNEINEAKIEFYLYKDNLEVNKIEYLDKTHIATFSSLSPGTYVYTVNITDKANNKEGLRRKIILEIDAEAPVLSFIDPTPSQNKEQNTTSIYVNVSVSDPGNNPIDKCTLKWNNIDYTMNKVISGANTYCYLLKSSLAFGTYTFKVISTNSKNKIGETEERTVVIKNMTTIIKRTFCGDDICQSSESCSTCPGDCGRCSRQACEEDWECTQWSSCLNNKKTRTCDDLNNCNTVLDKPALETACTLAGAEKEKKFDVNLNIPIDYKTIKIGDDVYSKIKIENNNEDDIEVNIKYEILDEDDEVVLEESEKVTLTTGNNLVKKLLKAPDEEGTYKLRVSFSYQDAKEEAEDTFVISGSDGGGESLNLSENILNMIIIGMIFISLLITIVMLRRRGSKPEEPKSALEQLKNFQQNTEKKEQDKNLNQQDKIENKNI